jgi:hypothetical protein
MISLGLMMATALSTTVAAQPANPPPARVLPNAPVREAPPAPAFKAGDPVIDSAGQVVGPIKTVTEGVNGALVVIEIDSKLVGVPQSTLKMDGARVVSSQTKAQMLAAADAPR